MAITFNINSSSASIIKVLGVGGGGGNAVMSMFRKGIRGVDFVVCNTDMQALERNPVPNKIRLGANLTQGLGCGADPDKGRQSALESIEEIRNLLRDNTRMVFVTAGMGGGTGTGAAPVIARLAKEMGILTVGIVTTPFKFEGDSRMRIAEEGIRELEDCVDTLLVINNANLMKALPKNVKARDAYNKADDVLGNAAKNIAEIITVDGYVNVDFADVNTIMKDSGTALMGSATFAGDDRAQLAVEEALSSPLLDNVDIQGATGILLNITASEDSITLAEIETIGEFVKEAAGNKARVIFGQVYNNEMGDDLSVTVIATGFNRPQRQSVTAIPAKAPGLDAKGLPIKGVQANLPLDSISLEKLRRRDMQPLEETAESLRPMSIEERVQRVQTQEYDLHNPNRVKNLEDQPAYLRRKVEIENDRSTPNNTLSRTTLNADANGKYQLRENNSFLFDNVD